MFMYLYTYISNTCVSNVYRIYRQILIHLIWTSSDFVPFDVKIRQVMQPAAAFVETLREIPKAMKDFLLNKAFGLLALTLWWTNILPWKITIFNGKIHYKWPFSIAMLNYQRVSGFRVVILSIVDGEIEMFPSGSLT